MITYILRRIFYFIPVMVGVNVIAFFLFFALNSPDDIAAMQLGGKRVSESQIQVWKVNNEYHHPMFFNREVEGLEKLTQTLFWQHSFSMFWFSFGSDYHNRDILNEIKIRIWPSFFLSFPMFLLSIFFSLLISMLVVMLRGHMLETVLITKLVVMMSISVIFYIILGQYILAQWWKWVPISGFQEEDMLKYLILPIIVGVLSGLGGNARFYRALLLEELEEDYVITAKAKGLSSLQLLFKHVLRNAGLPIVTHAVVVIPQLFLGSLLLESFFSIPGLGNYLNDALLAQDFSIVKAMVFLGTILYLLGLLLSDIVCFWVDPRVNFT